METRIRTDSHCRPPLRRLDEVCCDSRLARFVQPPPDADRPASTERLGVVVELFFQAEDRIRDYKVTGVQTCALPISISFAAGQQAANDIGSEAQAGFPEWRL